MVIQYMSQNFYRKLVRSVKSYASLIKFLHMSTAAVFVILVSVFSNFQMTFAQVGDTDFIQMSTTNNHFVPLHIETPKYPPQAFQDKIDGFTLMYFTVTKEGNVEPDSIVMINALPKNVFDLASKRAVAQFRFEPPFSHGENIELKFVTVQFRFRHEEDKVSVSLQTAKLMNREYLPLNYITPNYPPEASSEKLEGYVLIEFTVTREGRAAGIVILDRQPSNVFNASAIEAAERFRFQPRVVDGITSEAPGAQYLFRYELENRSQQVNLPEATILQ